MVAGASTVQTQRSVGCICAATMGAPQTLLMLVGTRSERRCLLADLALRCLSPGSTGAAMKKELAPSSTSPGAAEVKGPATIPVKLEPKVSSGVDADDSASAEVMGSGGLSSTSSLLNPAKPPSLSCSQLPLAAPCFRDKGRGREHAATSRIWECICPSADVSVRRIGFIGFVI